MNISIFGLGYVGCVGLGCLAETGHNMIGVDVDAQKVNLINNGKATIVEKEIDNLIEKHQKAGNLSATLDSEKAIINSEVAIICVGTPNDKNGHLDMTFIHGVSKQIARTLKEVKKDFFTIAIRSTVMPGTNAKIISIIEEESGLKNGIDFGIVSNPEFLREGTAVEDFMNPPFTVVASDSAKAMDIMEKVYSKINGEFVRAEVGATELIKFVNNSYHALKVAFGNEIGRICKTLGVDGHQVMDLFVKDKQLNISPYYFRPGFAYGGSCLPKDLKALNTIAHDYYVNLPILSQIDNSNHVHIDYVYHQINEMKVNRIGFYSISFKSGTDDLRFSPSLDLVERFLGKGYIVKVYDKNINVSKLMGKNKEFLLNKLPHIDNILCADFNEFLKGIDLLVVVNKDSFITDFNNIPAELKILDLIRIENLKNQSNINYNGVCW